MILIYLTFYLFKIEYRLKNNYKYLFFINFNHTLNNKYLNKFLFSIYIINQIFINQKSKKIKLKKIN